VSLGKTGIKMELYRSDKSKIGNFNLMFKTWGAKGRFFVNKLAFFCLKIGNFWHFFVSD